MQSLFIRALEMTINVVAAICVAAVVIAALAAFAGALAPAGGASGVALGIGILLGGAVYLSLTFGFLFLVLGVYRNTQRTADAMERMVR
jgi:hypothetical protein